MIFKQKITNIKKLNKKYESQKYLTKKDFHQLNPNLVTLSLSVNKKRFANYDKPIAGTVIESGFFDWKHVYISNNLFANSVADYPYNKIHKLVNKAKQLTIHQKAKTWFRLSDTKSFICFAGAGSGKTTGIVLPTIVANALSPTQPNLLITDPKGELAKSTFNFLKDNGYEVKVINLLDEKNSDCFSPFTLVKEFIWESLKFPIDSLNLSNDIFNQKIDIINNLDSELKNIIYSLNDQQGISNEQFWDQKASVAIYNIAWLIIDDLSLVYKNWELNNENLSNDEKLLKFNEIFIKFNFQSIYEILANFNNESFNKYKQFYEKNFNIDIENISPKFIKEHRGLQQFKNLWRFEGTKLNFSENIISNALKILEKFNIPSLYSLTMFSSFNLDDLYGDKERPFALFITINNSETSSLSYVSWFINYLLMKLNSYAIKGSRNKLKKPLMCIFEEIGNIPYIQFLPITVNEGRGKNIFVSLFFQTYAQYKDKYLSHGDFMRSCAYRVLLTNSEGKFVKELVSYAGTYQWLDKTTNTIIKENRLTENDIYSLPRFQAIIFQNEINIPYISGLIPYQLFGFNNLKSINVKKINTDYKHLAIYNPLTDTEKELTIDEANLFNFDFSSQNEFKLTINLKTRLLKLLDKMINFVEREEDKKYWLERKNKLESQTPTDEIKNNHQTNNKFSKNNDLDLLKSIFKSNNWKFEVNDILTSEINNDQYLDLNILDQNYQSKLNRLFNLDSIAKLLTLFNYEELINLKSDIQKKNFKDNVSMAYLKMIEFLQIKEEYFQKFQQHINSDLFKKIKKYFLFLFYLSQSFDSNMEINSKLEQQLNSIKEIVSNIDLELLKFLFSVKQFNYLFKWNEKDQNRLNSVLSDDDLVNKLSTLVEKRIINSLI